MSTKTRSFTETVSNLKNLDIRKPVGPESELKIMINELIAKQQEEKAFPLHSILGFHLSCLPADPSENELINILQFFKVVSESTLSDRLSLLCNPQNLFKFSERIYPFVTTLAHKSSSTTEATHAASQKSSSLLHKSVRISLNFIKALKPQELTEDDAVMLEQFGINLMDLLGAHPTAMLDVKCNGGLILCHLADPVFVDQCLTLNCPYPRPLVISPKPRSRFEEHFLAYYKADYVNQVSVAFGVFGTRQHLTHDCFRNIGNTILLHTESNSTKESVNLGSARVLEIWMEKIVPVSFHPLLTDVFPHIEIFIFTYLAGHIDAVKNCCRNMLANLSVVYSRLDAINGNQHLLQDLLNKILVMPYHMKWIGLAAATRNNPMTVILESMWTNPAEKLLCSERTFKNAASDVYLSMMQHSYKPNCQKWIDSWIIPLLHTQESQNNESNWSQKKSIILKAMSGSEKTNIKKAILGTVVTIMNQDRCQGLAVESWLLIVEVLKTATELGIALDMSEGSKPQQENEEIVEDKFRGVLPRQMFNSWTHHVNPQIRLASFSLLIDTRKTSEIFSLEDFASLKLLLKYNIVSQSPSFRQQVLAYFKKLMRRLKDGRSVCYRTRDLTGVEDYDNFIAWLWAFFSTDGLFPGASFCRRCQSLTCLVELLNNFPVTEFKESFEREESLGYIRWLKDTYENNKIAAVQILSQLNLPIFKDQNVIQWMVKAAITLLNSVKPPESVTGRYVLLLLLKASPLYPWNVLRTLLTHVEQIVYTLQKGTKTLLDVSSNNPPYGAIRAIRLIIDTYKLEIMHEVTTRERNTNRALKSGTHSLSFDILQEYVARLVKVCLTLDDILFPVLGDAAPEGFLPELNENENITPENSKIVRSLNAQMLLVSSWRSMKEVCILLTEFMVHFPLQGELEDGVCDMGRERRYFFTFDQVKAVGEHLLYLLTNLMHRGVFEQVFVGFKNLAQRLKKSKSRKIQKLSEEWLEEVMAKVADKCTTRRSAGLPFVFQAILTPEVGNEQVMTYWLQRLLDPDEPVREIMNVRIHSMNVLRALFRDANFAKAIMEWVPAGIRLAFKGLRASEWAEQNSGMMLYGSVIRRTFGPKLNLMNAPTFFRRFPDMYDFLLDEIQNTVKALISRDPSINITKENDLAYHLLLLFSSFAPAPGKVEEGQFRLAAFIPNIRACGSSRDIQVRVMAAKAVIPFITSPQEAQRTLEKCLDHIMLYSRHIRNNVLHGDLLQIMSIVSMMKQRNEVIGPRLVEKFQLIVDVPKSTTCPLIFETFANLTLLLRECPVLDSTTIALQKVNEESFLSILPSTSTGEVTTAVSGLGLAHAKEAVYESRIVFSFDQESHIRQSIESGDPILVDQLLTVVLAQDEDLYLPQQNNALLIRRYLTEKFTFVGQTDYELRYLRYFAKSEIHLKEGEGGFIPVEDRKEMWRRMLAICEADFGRVEVKTWAMRVWGKLIREELPDENLQDEETFDNLCNLMEDWTETKYDDDLRLAAAAVLPNLPMGNHRFSVENFCKLWKTALTIGQDDEVYIRTEVFKKIQTPEKKIPGCSLRCWEVLIETFFLDINCFCPVEGLWSLLTLLLNDDYEVVATVADDEDEDRLFEKSEMNLFAEKRTMANIVVDYLNDNRSLQESFRTSLSTPWNSNQMAPFMHWIESLPNFKEVDFQKDTLTHGQVLEKILESDSKSEAQLEEEDDDDDKDCKDEVEEILVRIQEKNLVQEHIREALYSVFCSKH